MLALSHYSCMFAIQHVSLKRPAFVLLPLICDYGSTDCMSAVGRWNNDGLLAQLGKPELLVKKV